jgi:hypothetical protein
LYVLLSVIGLGVIWRQNRKAAALLIAPLLVTVAAAVARQYPFSDRLIVFLLPAILLAIGAAVGWVYGACARISKPLAVLIAVVLLAPGVYPIAVSPPPYRIEHVKPVLSYLRAHWQSGDSAYVYYGAAPGVTFYAVRYGFSSGALLIGGCHRGESRRYLQELDTLRGRSRVWILVTHSTALYREREDILAYLDTIGERRDEFVVRSHAVGRTPTPAEVFLYDLSDKVRLANGAAESFPLTGGASPPPGFGCEAGAQTIVPSDFP